MLLCSCESQTPMAAEGRWGRGQSSAEKIIWSWFGGMVSWLLVLAVHYNHLQILNILMPRLYPKIIQSESLGMGQRQAAVFSKVTQVTPMCSQGWNTMIWKAPNLTIRTQRQWSIKSDHLYSTIPLFGITPNMHFEFMKSWFQWSRTQLKSICFVKQMQTTTTSATSWS